MTLCLVTDRRRLGAAAGIDPSGWIDLLVTQVRGAVAGGVDLIQLREPDLEAAEILRLLRRILAEVPGARGRLVVNDRLDIALTGGASGVHLRERSFGVQEARRLTPPGFLVGRSVHDARGAGVQRDASYLIAGTVLSTVSKPAGRPLGWDGLFAVVASAEGRPVLGIGGLTRACVPRLVQTGAAGLAAIGAFVPEGEEDLFDFVQEEARNLRFAFDSTRGVS